jgi:hypothetical protein
MSNETKVEPQPKPVCVVHRLQPVGEPTQAARRPKLLDPAGDLPLNTTNHRFEEFDQHGRMTWGRDEGGWIAPPHEIVETLSRHGYQEYKREVARSRRDRRPSGGVWQGLNVETGSVASVIWVRRGVADDATVFIEIDGEPLVGS